RGPGRGRPSAGASGLGCRRAEDATGPVVAAPGTTAAESQTPCAGTRLAPRRDMASWSEIRRELMRCTIARDGERGISFHAMWEGRSSVVALRLVRTPGAEWVVIQTAICRVGEASLEGLLRRAAEDTMGAVVIEVDECLLRERVPLGPLAAGEIHPLVDRV